MVHNTSMNGCLAWLPIFLHLSKLFTQEGLDVGGTLGEGRAVDLCQTAKRCGGYHGLRHPCSPWVEMLPLRQTVTAPVTVFRSYLFDAG